MSGTYKSWCSCVLLFLCFAYSQQFLAGPYEMVVKKVENCPEAGSKKFFVENLKVKRTKQDVISLDGKIVTKVEMGDKVEGKVDVWSRNGNKKVSRFFTHDFSNLCKESIKFLPDVYKDCPYAANEYVLKKELPIKFSSAVPATMPYGSYWIMTEFFTNGGEMIGCLEMTVDFIARDGNKKL